jgi:hypothetical protein
MDADKEIPHYELEIRERNDNLLIAINYDGKAMGYVAVKKGEGHEELWQTAIKQINSLLLKEKS